MDDKLNILVIGESCKDKFIYGKTPRLSPEGPVPIFQPTKTVENEGMAMNVVENLRALNNKIGLISNSEEIKKTRYVDEAFNHLIMRVDENDSCDRVPNETISGLVGGNIDAIVISDYDKGFLKAEDIYKISETDTITICDTKKELGDWCRKLTFIKLNRKEYYNNKHFIDENDWILDKLIVTLDKDGTMYKETRYPTKKVEIMDISGAGDTFVAGFISKYVRTKDIGESINFGNQCATEVVQKKGVNIVSEKNI